jgi:hypothetical protein
VTAAAGGAALLVANALAVRSGRPLFDVVPVTYRYWEAVRAGAASGRGTADGPFVPASVDPFTHAVATESARLGIRVTRFWRSVPLTLLPAPSTGRITALEDVGAARLLAVCFRALDGVAPYLLLWIPALLAAPALGALALGFAAMGRPLAGAILALLIGASAFFADALFLAYSPFGFYVVALFLLAAFSAWAAGVESRAPRAAELVAALVVGLVLALCAACRGGVLLLFPGFLAAAVGLAARRRRAGWWTAAAMVALLIAPSVAFRPSESHNVWISVWQGLGDFDLERGHVWSDADAKRTLRAAGVDDLRGAEAERTMRALVLADVRTDPAWYAAILARRVRAIVLQEKISPWRQERPLAAPTGPGEGAMDAYYGLTRHADTFAAGGSAAEVPTWMLWAPLALLAALAVGGQRMGQSAASAAEWRRDTLALLPLAVGALAVPVLISTAGAFETQAFLIVHLAAAALLFDGGRRAARRRRAPVRRSRAHGPSDARAAGDTA